ncbi:MAG TPA: hypothetical protein VGC67_13000 [Cellulomonas sp.]
MSALVTALGWFGAVTCLIAYVMVTRGRWAATSGRYQLTNVIAGLFMGLVAARSGVWPSVVTNVVWTAVGAHAVAVVLRTRRARSAGAGVTTARAEEPADAEPDALPAQRGVLPAQRGATVDLAA